MAQLVSTGLGDLIPMVRSEGKHVSHAIRKLCIQLGHFEDTPLPEDRSLLELGSAFEDLLCGALATRVALSDPDRYARIGEQELDGVYGTPDLFDVTDHAVIEVKLTQMSVKHHPDSPKFWRYWKQLQAYCHMLGTNKGRLHIVHEVDWSFGKLVCPHCNKLMYRSHYHVWEPDGGEFSQSELESNWQMIKAYA